MSLSLFFLINNVFSASFSIWKRKREWINAHSICVLYVLGLLLFRRPAKIVWKSVICKEKEEKEEEKFEISYSANQQTKPREGSLTILLTPGCILYINEGKKNDASNGTFSSPDSTYVGLTD